MPRISQQRKAQVHQAIAAVHDQADAPPPAPTAIVRAYPNPLEIFRAYIAANFARQLATDHEATVATLAEQVATVSDATSLQRVEEVLVDVAEHRRRVESWFKPIKDFAWHLHRIICDRESEILRPLLVFESAAKLNAQAYRREDERKRREEEQRLQAEARRVEQERLETEAALLEQRGEAELAQAVLEAAVHAPAPVITVASTLPTTKGVTYRANWRWRPIGGDTPQNRARAEKLVPRDFLELSDKKLNAWAKAHGASARIPGIEFYDAGSVAVRS